MGFGFRPLTRDDLLGTLITISGVICFNQFSGVPRRPPTESEFEVFITSKRTILCIAKGQELINLNDRHMQAASVRKHWSRIRKQLWHKVDELLKNPIQETEDEDERDSDTDNSSAKVE